MNASVPMSSEKPSTDPIHIQVSADEMYAYAQISDFSLPLPHLVKKFKQSLARHGIRKGILPENIKRLLWEKNPHLRLVIARGLPVEDTVAASYQKLVSFESRPPLVIENNLPIDLKKLRHGNLVFQGTPLLQIAVQKKQTTITVTGKTVELPADAESLIKLGPNVKLEEGDALQVVATTDGLAIMKDHDWIDVIPCTVVKHSVPASSVIRSEHSIIVLGDVETGCSLQTPGDIEVYGTVKDSVLKAGNDLIIQQGFVGKNAGVIEAGRHTLLGFAHNKHIQTGQVLWFDNELINCNVFAAKKIISQKGRVVGGNIEALEQIDIKSAGSSEEIGTHLQVGRTDYLKEKKEQLNEMIQEYFRNLDEVKKNIYDLVIKKVDRTITLPELEMLEQFQLNKEIIPEKIKELEENLTRLNNEIERMQRATISIHQDIFPGVVISIGDYSRKIYRADKRLEFKLMDGRIFAYPII